MKTLRMDERLEDLLARAAAATGESLSEFIRKAAEARANSVLDVAYPDQFIDVIGVVRGGGGRARATGAAFGDALIADRLRERESVRQAERASRRLRG